MAKTRDYVKESGDLGGRPSKYLPEYSRIVRKMCNIGMTDAEIADALEINRSTLWRWRREHTTFCNAFIDGRAKQDQRVKRRLFERAIEGDVSAIQFYLKNRLPAEWRDKQEIATTKPLEVIEHSELDDHETGQITTQSATQSAAE